MGDQTVTTASNPSPSREPRPSSRLQTDIEPIVHAVAATALLVARYTQQTSVQLDVDGTAESAVRFDLRTDSTVRALRDDLRGQLSAHHGAAANRALLRLCWAELPASANGARLVLTVRLLDLYVDPAGVTMHGLLAGSDATARLLEHFQVALHVVRAPDDTDLSHVSLLGDTERRRLLDTFSCTEVLPALATPHCLHALFAAQAARAPDRIAIECGAERLSYGELAARAATMASSLRRAGMGPGKFVAFLLPRSSDVYVAMLAILESGAAYVPLDPDWPHDRVAAILADSSASLLLTTTAWAADGRATVPCPMALLDGGWHVTSASAPTTGAVTADDLCYAIYTSGSTGRPKGVAIRHASAAHLVRAEQHVFKIVPSDRILQGFSVAFDASVEEIWLALAAGATLVVGIKDKMLSDLSGYLRDLRISVFSTVPTLLATVTTDLPTVRLLIVGGEACPPSLVERFATPERAMYNTYGPTETTVVATYTRLERGRAVTIGRPLPNYRTYILDAAGQPLPLGIVGEVCIGGPGLAAGYIGQRALTDSRFVANRFAGAWGAPARLYRTGDLGRYTADGDIEFVGRCDGQVKLRGFRIELDEITHALLEAEPVVQAFTMVREDFPGARQLVAYVVLRDGAGPAPDVLKDALKDGLRKRLPEYMIPAHIEALAALPTLASGKVDKRALPPPLFLRESTDADAQPRGPLECQIATAWMAVFQIPGVGRHTHFFHDLGGHSLAAAQVVSLLRQEPAFATLSVLDIYEQPTIAGIAERQSHKILHAEADPTEAAEITPRASRWAYAGCGMAQLVALYGLFGFYSLQWLAPYLVFGWLGQHNLGSVMSLTLAAAVLLAVYPLTLLVALAAKWLLIGRYKAGHHPLWGSYYLRFWLVRRIVDLAPIEMLENTPLLNIYYRLLGARIGKNVHLAARLQCFDLITIDDDATIGIDANLPCHVMEDGVLSLGPVRVGARAVVGGCSTLGLNAALAPDAVLGELSYLGPGKTVPAGEYWQGSPACRVSAADVSTPIHAPRRRTHALMTTAYACLVLLLPVFTLGSLLPGLVLLYELEAHWGAWNLLAAPVAALLFVATLCIEIVAIKWLLVGRVAPGRYPIFSGLFLRKWLFDRAMDVSLDVIGGLYATLYVNPWLRMLGMRIGKNAEISTLSASSPDLLSIGEEAFVADSVSIGMPHLARGVMEIAPTRVGARTFIGNGAVVPSGSVLGEDCLIGCLSTTPPASQIATVDGASWFGSPPILMPRRQSSAAYGAEATYRPTRKLVRQRLGFEALRILLPTTCFVVLSYLLLRGATALENRGVGPGTLMAVFPLGFIGLALGAAALVVAMKWLLMGRYRPDTRPLWSAFVWRNELVTAMHENVANPLLNDLLRGTPFAAWFFRALGAKIGRRVYLETTEFTEYDLITIGDDVCLNDDCTIQTHLFEDRVMKMSTIAIGARCNVGAGAVVLYDTVMLPGATLAPLSLLLKSEVLPAGSRWQGSPAQPVSRREGRPARLSAPCA